MQAIAESIALGASDPPILPPPVDSESYASERRNGA